MKNKISVYYDEVVDVMYISLSNEKHFYAEQNGDYIEIKSDKEDKIIGYTILNYTEHLLDKSIFKMPWRNIDFLNEVIPVIEKYFEDED